MLMREITFTIDEKDDKKQIKDFLKSFGVSASLLSKLKRSENGIMKNGVFAKTIETLCTGDELKITIPDSGTPPQPTKLDVQIIYEDEDILVLNKPPLMPVHESRNHIGDTLSNFVSYHCGTCGAFRAVFRLDRDTSGLVLIAKHELAAAKLAGKISKDYYAVLTGTPSKKVGIINAPIARCGDSIIKRKVDESGEYAVSEYKVIKEVGGNALVKFKLQTGRTHQIRVHSAYIGHPLLGDTMYGGDDALIKRQALHCKDIYFTHPITNKEIHLTCDFPDDIKEVL